MKVTSDKSREEIRAIFQKYMREKKEHKTHALYSPSGMERTLGCLGSVNQIKLAPPPKDNPHSILGTNAHTLLEFILKEGESFLGHAEGIPFLRSIDFSSEMLDAVRVAVKFIKSEYKNMIVEDRKPRLLVERKVHLEHIVDADCSGTADIIMYQPYGVLHVMDYKNGKSVVEAKDNYQMMTYALGFLDEMGWDFSEVWLSIIQPNAKGPAMKTWKTSIRTMEEYEKRLTLGVKKSKHPDAPLTEDYKWCFFCPARLQCPLKKERVTDKVLDRFKKSVLNKNKRKVMT